jgi:hypothetical protein
MVITKEEKETIIRWDESEDIVHIYTASKKVRTKLSKIKDSKLVETSFIEGEEIGWTYTLPSINYISILANPKKRF